MSSLNIPQKFVVYFANPETTDDAQRDVILAKDLATVQDIYSEYRVISIEVVDDHPAADVNKRGK